MKLNFFLQVLTTTLGIYLTPPPALAEPLPHDVFRVGNSREIESLDPVLVDGAQAGVVAAALFEGLVISHPKTLAVQPGVAKDWSISPDQKIYQFNLRADARWSDGKPLTAEDFRYSWLRALQPASRAYYAHYMDDIENARAFRQGKIKDPNQVGIYVRSAQVLEIHLEQPSAVFLQLLTSPVFYPVAKRAVQKNPTDWAKPEHMISNGPFALKEWRLKEKLVVTRNPHYHSSEQIHMRELHFLPVESPKTAWQMYQAGDLDWLRVLPRSELKTISQRSDFHSSPRLSTVYIRINTEKGPLKDARVRRAISYGLDRKVLAERFAREGQVPASQFVSPNIPGYESQVNMRFQPDHARKLLAEAGYPGGKGFPPMQFLYVDDPQSKAVALAISAMLRQNLGIAISPKNLERGAFYDRLDQLSYDLARSSWTAKYPDAASYLEKFTSSNTWQNLTGYSSPEYDALIKEATASLDPVIRQKRLAAAEHLLVEKDCAIIPLYFNVSTNLWKKDIEGLFENPMDVHPLRSVRRIKTVATRP